jgi:hypothetical protein
MLSQAKSDGQAPWAAQTTRCSPEGPQTHAHERVETTLPLLQWHGNASVMSEDEIVASTASPPAAIGAKGLRKGEKRPVHDIEKHREQLIRLFWTQGLPLKEVRAIMERDHGLELR